MAFGAAAWMNEATWGKFLLIAGACLLFLMMFGWLWGIVGLLLSVPMLVCVKIVLSKLEGLEGWAKLLE